MYTNVYWHDKFHMLSCDGSLVTSLKGKAKHRIRASTMLLFHILWGKYFNQYF